MDLRPISLQAKQAARLWLAGFREACCLHRAFSFCRSSRTLSIKTLQCFLLNGLLFLGSLYMLRSVVIPILHCILPDKISPVASAPRLYAPLRDLLVQLFYILWFFPIWTLSFILGIFWYNDMAKHALSALQRLQASDILNSENSFPTSEDHDPLESPAGLEGTIIGAMEQVYSIVLLDLFFIEVAATEYIPYIGKPINFLLLSWLYSYYCFEYKWNHFGTSFSKRIHFFESNWPFFAGFGHRDDVDDWWGYDQHNPYYLDSPGSPCVLPMFFFPRLVGYGVMAMLYPLFVLTAIGTHGEEVIRLQRRLWREELMKLSIFSAADTLLTKAMNICFGKIYATTN